MLRRIPPKNMEVPRALPVGLHEILVPVPPAYRQAQGGENESRELSLGNEGRPH
jgi:hypothetical protein